MPRTQLSGACQWPERRAEPMEVGGNDSGPTSYDQLLAALGICTFMTLGMYVCRKQLPLDSLVITLQHSRRYPERKKYYRSRPVRYSGQLRGLRGRENLPAGDRITLHGI